MSSISPTGFLIVLVSPSYRNPRNMRYRGVDRVPEYPGSIPEEAEALDEYVFGEYKSTDDNLIHDYHKALELWKALSVSPRRFELVLCCTGPDDPLIGMINSATKTVSLGFDVASVRGDCWSIVEDIPNSNWAIPYQNALNQNGLFCTRHEADEYLREYRDHREADHDNSFDVVFVVKVGELSERGNKRGL